MIIHFFTTYNLLYLTPINDLLIFPVKPQYVLTQLTSVTNYTFIEVNMIYK